MYLNRRPELQTMQKPDLKPDLKLNGIHNRVGGLGELDFGHHIGHSQKPYEQLSKNNLGHPTLSYFETSDLIWSTILSNF